MISLNQIVVSFLVAAQLLILVSEAFAGQDGFPGRRRGGGSRHADPSVLTTVLGIGVLAPQSTANSGG